MANQKLTIIIAERGTPIAIIPRLNFPKAIQKINDTFHGGTAELNWERKQTGWRELCLDGRVYEIYQIEVDENGFNPTWT